MEAGFNGATAFQPWKSTSVNMPRIVSSSFNGATAFQPWKSERSLGLRRRAIRASMGPRPFSRGNVNAKDSTLLGRTQLQWGHGLSAVEMSTPSKRGARRAKALQWGHGLSAVEMARSRTLRRHRPPLQWGHGLSAVEIQRASPELDIPRRASMGPRPFSRGNTPRPRMTTPTV